MGPFAGAFTGPYTRSPTGSRPTGGCSHLHVRPTAIDGHYWSWQYVRTQPWLRQHNFRGAGSHGMGLA